MFLEKLATYRAGIIVFIELLVPGVYYLFTKLWNPDWTDDLSTSNGAISIAVMPFQNLTQDTGLSGRKVYRAGSFQTWPTINPIKLNRRTL